MNEGYRDGDTIYILMKADRAASVLEDWIEGNRECDLQICRPKNARGCVVIKTRDLMWAGRVMQWHGYEEVAYKRVPQDHTENH